MKYVVIITVIESVIVASLLILWRFKSTYSKIPAALPLQPIIANDVNMTAALKRRRALDDSRWAFINRWQVVPQADDRPPVRSGVRFGSDSPSGNRSMARRRHQAMYKEWSQSRHE